MTIQELQNTIAERAIGGRFRFIQSDYGSDNIQRVFRQFIPGGDLEIDQAVVTTTEAEQVALSGVLTNDFMGTTNLVVQLTFSVENGAAEFRMELSHFPEDWTLGQAIPALKDSLMDQLPWYLPRMVLASATEQVIPQNFQTRLGYPQVAEVVEDELMQGLWFEGELIPTQVPGVLKWVFATNETEATSRIKMVGPIEVHGEDLVLDWNLPESRSLALLSEQVPLSFRLVRTQAGYRDAGRMYYPKHTARFGLELPIGSVRLPIVGFIDDWKTRSITVYSQAEEGAAPSLQELIDWLPGDNPLDALPAEFSILNSVTFQKLTLSIDFSTWSIDFVSIELMLEERWSFFDDKFALYDPGMILTVADPFDSATRRVGIELNGKVDISDTTLLARIQFPNTAWWLTMVPEDDLNIKALLEDLAGYSPPMPEVVVTDLYLSGHLKDREFNMSMAVQSDWTVDLGATTVGLQEMRLEFNYRGGTEGYKQMLVYGKLTIGSTALAVSVVYGGGWQISGYLTDGTTANLTTVARDLAEALGTSLPDNLPELEIRNFYFSYETATGDLACELDLMAEIPTKLGETEFSLQTRINLDSEIGEDGQRNFIIDAEAILELGSEWIELTYDLGETQTTYRGTWRSEHSRIGPEGIVELLGLGKQLDLPDGMDWGLAELSFTYATGAKQFTLAGRTADNALVYFTIGKTEAGDWAIVMGMNWVPKDGKLSQLPGIGQYLEVADFLTIKSAGILIATEEIRDYDPPALPPLPQDTSDSGDAIANVQPVNDGHPLTLKKGFAVVAQLDLEALATDFAPLQLILDMLGDTDLLFQISFSPEEASFYAALPGEVPIPNKKNPILTLSNAGVRFRKTKGGVDFAVQGGFDFEINGEEIAVDATLLVETDGIAASVNIQADEDGIQGPPGLKGFHLFQLDFLLGIDFTPPSLTMALQGQFRIGEREGGANNQFGMALAVVGNVPKPNYLSFYIQEAGLDELITLVTNEPVSGGLKVLENIQGYDLQFYWASEQVIMPDGTVALPGFSFGGLIKIFGFGAYAEFVMKTGEGIRGEAQIGPIDLKGVLKVTGNGSGIDRVYEQVDGDWRLVDSAKAITEENTNPVRTESIVKPGGAVVKFDTSSTTILYMNWNITLFDLVSQSVEVTVSTSGIAFSLTYKVSKALKLAIACSMESYSKFAGSASFKLNINVLVPGFKINGIQVGDLRVKSKVSLALAINVSSNTFSLKLTGSFKFQDVDFTMPKVQFTADPGSLKDIATWVIDKIKDEAEDLFADLFSSAEDFVKNVGEGIVEGAEETAKVFSDAYNLTSKEAAKVLEDAGETAEDALNAVSSAYNLGSDAIADVGADLGMTASQVGNHLKKVGGYSDEAVSAALQGANYA
ncbi:MAG: hypothetical protein AAFQ98_17600, partial [Bacteroidota bacterium]